MIPPLHAAQLIAADYFGRRAPGAILSRDLGSAEYVVIESGDDAVLLCRGSNEPVDWLRNFRWAARSWPEIGDSGCMYHRGFLRGAREIWHDLGREMRGRITQVIGHSKGAAEGGIVAASLGVPGVMFATPRVVAGRHTLAGAKHVTNIIRRDDLVTWVPPWYRHLGSVEPIPVPWRRGGTHGIAHYIEGMQRFEKFTSKVDK